MEIKYVWGLFINDGDGDQLLYHFGLYTTEQKANEFYNEIYPNGSRNIWVDKVEIKG